MSQSSNDPASHAIDGKLLRRLPRIAGVLALVLILVYAVVFRSLPIGERPDAWGQFGDFMGGLLNPLISLFTLIVAVSVWELQKSELLETRKALEDQGKTAEQQRREQRFFDLLNIYRSTVDSIEFEFVSKTGTVTTLKGKRAFKFLCSANSQNPLSMLFLVLVNPSQTANPIDIDYDSLISEWDQQSPVLDHYFRTVFALLREAEITLNTDHWRYMKLFRAQLSRDEVNLMAMNLLYDDEGKKMRPLIVRYGMLKHMPSNTLRKLAERDLSPNSFGTTWAQQHPANGGVVEETHAN